MHLASVSAGAASNAFVSVNLCEIVGICHRAFYSPIIDSSQYAAAATATVANVAHIFHNVADGMDQTDFLCLVQKRKRLFL
jgi:hypothetical protein